MEIAFPAITTYWIISCGGSVASGKTEPSQVTTFGPDWEMFLQTTDLSEWQAAVESLPQEPPE